LALPFCIGSIIFSSQYWILGSKESGYQKSIVGRVKRRARLPSALRRESCHSQYVWLPVSLASATPVELGDTGLLGRDGAILGTGGIGLVHVPAIQCVQFFGIQARQGVLLQYQLFAKFLFHGFPSLGNFQLQIHSKDDANLWLFRKACADAHYTESI
jgi:hypothetical protein